MNQFIWFTLTIIYCLLTICLALNPYRVLEVPKSATIAEIKKSFKNLAKKYHPDKNQNNDAQEKFIELNKAYEILMDPERKRLYDRTGQTEDSPNFKHKSDYRSGFNRFDFDTFDTFFDSNDGRNFRFTFNSGSYFRKHSITHRAYENTILPQSYTTPYILVFYGDLCVPCIQVEQVLRRLVGELEAVGVGFCTVHSQHEIALTRKIGVRSLPYIISLIDGDIRPFRESEISLSTMIGFIKRSLPKDLIIEINNNNYYEFLSGWKDNKVRVLFANPDRIIRLRYVLIAFYFHERIAFGHVKTDDANTNEVLRRYHIDPKMNSMLVFNEDINSPTASLSVSELKTQIMKDVLDSNKYLFLPRVTSQTVFDHLCPVASLPSRAKLCVMLVSGEKEDNKRKFHAMRAFMKENDFPKDRFRFMYIYREKQAELIKSLTNIGLSKKVNINRGIHVVILWRKESNQAFYEWLNNEWDFVDSTYINETKQKLNLLMTRLSQNAAQFTYSAKINSLTDESAKSLFARIVKRLLLVTENLSDNISRTDPTPILSVVFSIIFIIFIGYVMTYFMKIEEESIREKYRKMGRQVPGSSKPSDCKLSIHELRGETYNGMIRLLKPGCRTIVLLCDNSSKSKLLPQFYKAVYPYRKNKTLMFAFLLVEKNIDWYKKLLLQTLGGERELNINPKNCIGTVISINGFRKYFCVFHAKHPENNIALRRMEENGEFLGLNEANENSGEESDVESGMLVRNHNPTNNNSNNVSDLSSINNENDDVIFENNLLNGLPNWLDKLFDGSTTRYYINFWPEHMK
ncbi:dnaJ homolog subfamily C member 16 l(3)80Fg isoform X2 [Dermatophagoides farinae]|uniref:dnaJ homolog subfamily C member 16 l(3)80Fg isoform X2 n=1 Tax=Dermatophagoides farinae TaxID=6954 RepID=UPI003F62CCC1